MSAGNAEREILLIEDNRTDARVIVNALQTANVIGTINHCYSGEEAIEYLMNRSVGHGIVQPAMILLDLSMPGLAGLDVLKVVKTTAKLRSIPVVMLTTSDEPSDVNACFAAGANSYIKKPVGIARYAQVAEGLASYWFDLSKIPELA